MDRRKFIGTAAMAAAGALSSGFLSDNSSPRPVGIKVGDILVDKEAMPFLETAVKALNIDIKLAGSCSNTSEMWWEEKSEATKDPNRNLDRVVMMADAVFGNRDRRVTVKEASWLSEAYAKDAISMQCSTPFVESSYREPLLKIADTLIETDAIIPLIVLTNTEKQGFYKLAYSCEMRKYVVNAIPDEESRTYSSLPSLEDLTTSIESLRKETKGRITVEDINSEFLGWGKEAYSWLKENKAEFLKNPGEMCKAAGQKYQLDRVRRAGQSFKQGIDILAGKETKEADDNIGLLPWPKGLAFAYQDGKRFISVDANALSAVLPIAVKKENGILVAGDPARMVLDVERITSDDPEAYVWGLFSKYATLQRDSGSGYQVSHIGSNEAAAILRNNIWLF